jgi:predicted transcriptional regulator of viral defense system
MKIFNYYTFQQELAIYEVFSLKDIKKIFPDFDSRRLVEWQEKGYIEKIINRWYRFKNKALQESMIWWASNRIYGPSYISLETALSFHGLIPEGVFQTTAISTAKTQHFDTPTGYFDYRNIKPSLFFGYNIHRINDKPVKIADIEKSLLDYCYFNKSMKNSEDFEGLRLNIALLQTQFDVEKMHNYLTLAQSPTLEKRVYNFVKYIENA